MSYGSISAEAHENLAIAMNRIEENQILVRAARKSRGFQLTVTVTIDGLQLNKSPLVDSVSQQNIL